MYGILRATPALPIYMNPAEEHILLLSDAIDRTIANPTASHCWLGLMELTRDITCKGLLQEVVENLVMRIPDHGLAGFYLASFLDMATGDKKFLAQASSILKSIMPHDPDRLAAFFELAWQRALLYSSDRSLFTQRLNEINLPELSILIGEILAQQLGDPPIPKHVSKVGKVAIVAPQLSSVLHPPTRMALDQAEVLIQNGIKVNLFTCQETQGPSFEHLLGTGANVFPQSLDLTAWAKSVMADVAIHASDQRFSVMRRWQDMLKNIQAFDPDLVVFVGMHSGLVSALYRTFPVLGLANNSIPPLVPTDVWLTAQAELANVVSRPWCAGFPESLAWHHPYRVRRKVGGGKVTRDSLGLRQDALVLVSMASHSHIRIAGDWADRMCATISTHSEVIWVLIGGEGILPPALSRLKQDRFRVIAHTPHALDILAISDIYVNPPMMGGGFSVAEAMSIGLPVLCFANSDGGDKVGDAAFVGTGDYFHRLDELIRDPALRYQAGKDMRTRFDSALDLEASGPALIAACNQAVERFNQRTKSLLR